MDSTPNISLLGDVEPELLVIGSGSSTYQFGQVVIEVPRVDEEAEITQENARATKTEADIHKILGKHDRIAKCLYISPTSDTIMLECYSHGNLKDYVAFHGLAQLMKWANQMIEGVQFIHSKGVRHSDIRLSQWLLGSRMNARLRDFNSSGFGECHALGIPSQKALEVEDARRFMPRDCCEDNSVRSDLFALGTALYEIECGNYPFADRDEETITHRFAQGNLPSVSDLTLGSIISGSWKGEFDSATAMLKLARTLLSASGTTEHS
ncbi:hypothetical protein KC345_g917 [Hortaea werneckii]|nr:hypothetical protein KC345_g917 [Hortaea werneckii]